MTFDEAFAAELALYPTAPTPTPDENGLGYGTDLSCTDDFAIDFGEVDPRSTRAISEALYRRLTTPRGSLPDDASYGYDVRAQLNRGATPVQIQAIGAAIKGECGKDDRVNDATVTIDYTEATKTSRVQITIDPADIDLASFDLILQVTSAAVLIETITG